MCDPARASTPAQAAGSPSVWAEIQIEGGGGVGGGERVELFPRVAPRGACVNQSP